jgi:hypothetical protein
MPFLIKDLSLFAFSDFWETLDTVGIIFAFLTGNGQNEDGRRGVGE